MVKRIMFWVLVAALTTGCRKKEEPPQESTPELVQERPVRVMLVTGDVLDLRLTMQDEDAYFLKGPQGTGRFPKALVRAMEDAPEEPKRKPGLNLPGFDLFGKSEKARKPPGRYVARSGGRVFHKKSCRLVPNIPSEKRVEFQTAEEARRQGFTACGLCNP